MRGGARDRIRSRPYVWQPVCWSPDRVLTRGWVDGLPALTWGCADREQLATARQLRELGLRPAGQAPVAVLVFGHTQPYRRQVEHAGLYRIAQAAPKRTATPTQRAAIEKALAARRTCQRCGEEQGYYLSTISRLCGPCEDATGFWDERTGLDPPETARDQAHRVARQVADSAREPVGPAKRADPSYVCEDCGTTEQWSCDCWELEAAKYDPDRIADEDRPWWLALVEGAAPDLGGGELADTLQAAETHRRTAALHTAQAVASADTAARARLEREATEAAALAALLDTRAAQQHAAGTRDGVEPSTHLGETDLADGPDEAGVVAIPVQRTPEPPPSAPASTRPRRRSSGRSTPLPRSSSSPVGTPTTRPPFTTPASARRTAIYRQWRRPDERVLTPHTEQEAVMTDSVDWDDERHRKLTEADYWRAEANAASARLAAEIARCAQETRRVLHRADYLLGGSAEQPVVPAARKHGALRSALADQLRCARGWPLSTAELRKLVGRELAGGGVYPALRVLERAGLCVRVRDDSFLSSRSVYWCVPGSPFADGSPGQR